MLNDLKKIWYPIASSAEVQKRHVFHAQLLGREYAVWRADDGNVNVWENRCLHRGVRLTIGINEGSELRCQYHGWRYANRTAGCTYIPAHPADAPARTICNNTYPVKEAMGMVWSGEEAFSEPVHFKNFEKYTVLRPVPINGNFNVIRELNKTNHFRLDLLTDPTKFIVQFVTGAFVQNDLVSCGPLALINTALNMTEIQCSLDRQKAHVQSIGQTKMQLSLFVDIFGIEQNRRSLVTQELCQTRTMRQANKRKHDFRRKKLLTLHSTLTSESGFPAQTNQQAAFDHSPLFQ